MESNYIHLTKESLPDLTTGLKKVADFLLKDPMVFATHPAKKVGKMIGVSETMVIRFCNQIGYSGYVELQREVRRHLLKLNSQESGEPKSVSTKRFLHSMMHDASNLKRNVEHVDEEAMGQAIEWILKSERVLVTGYYQSFSFAHWFSYNLNLVKGNAHLYRPENDAGLLGFTADNSCVVIFSFFRYALDTMRIAEEAREKGIKIIAISDSWASPVAEFADIMLPLAINEQSTLLNKGPVAMSFMNSMLFEIINRMENRGKVPETYKYFIKDGEE